MVKVSIDHKDQRRRLKTKATCLFQPSGWRRRKKTLGARREQTKSQPTDGPEKKRKEMLINFMQNDNFTTRPIVLGTQHS